MDIYQRDQVTVDENFARFGSKSYAINKITSVDVHVHETRRNGWLFAAIFGAIMLLAGLSSLGIPDNDPPFMSFGIAIVCGVFAVTGYRNRLSRHFELMLATAAGEVQATRSPDGDAIQELREVIERRVAAKP